MSVASQSNSTRRVLVNLLSLITFLITSSTVIHLPTGILALFGRISTHLPHPIYLLLTIVEILPERTLASAWHTGIKQPHLGQPSLSKNTLDDTSAVLDYVTTRRALAEIH